MRRAAAHAAKKARDLKAQSIATIVHGAGIGRLSPLEAAQATVEGTLLALYHYDAPGVDQEPPAEIHRLTIVEFDEEKLDAIREGTMAFIFKKDPMGRWKISAIRSTPRSSPAR